MLAVSTQDCGSCRVGSNPTGRTKKGETMFWYVKEEGWNYQALHGPFETKEEAKCWKQSNCDNVTYRIFNSKDLLQPV